MSYATDDLTPLLAQAAAPGVGYRQGIVRAWNPVTAENTVEVDGNVFTDLSILNTNEALQLAEGDIVGILTTGGAAGSWAILGRLTIPGTDAAASALRAVSSGIQSAFVSAQEQTTSITYGDLATVGPQVTVRIRSSGKALVFVTCQLGFSVVADASGMGVSFVASGANTLGTSGQRSINMFSLVTGAPSMARVDQLGGSFYLDGLNPGNTTFTLKYRSQQGHLVDFSDRGIVVWPL